MGKRSGFERRDRDAYPTPVEAIVPLLPFLPFETRFFEPCAGDGALIRHLEAAGHQCIGQMDIGAEIAQVDRRPEYFISNPPWARPILHKIIFNLFRQAPTWLLIDANWMFTRQAAPWLQHCAAIVTVGRVKWIPDSPFTGKDDAAWFLFHRCASIDGTRFFGRSA